MTDTMTAMPKYERYKDSGFEPIGDIPEHWDVIANRHIFTLKKSKVGKKSDQYDLLSLTLKGVIKRDMDNPEGKFPSEFDTYQTIETGDFIFCLFDVEETPRTVGISPFNGMITGAYTTFKASPDINPEYLHYLYYCLDKQKVLKPLYRGLRNTIPKESFYAFNSILPPKEEQERIVAFLDEKSSQIDEAITIKEQQIALLKERMQAIIQNAVTKGLNPDAPMKDSGVDWIGDIPSHWGVKKIKHYLKIKNGQDHKEVVSDDGQYPIFGSGGEFAKANDYLYQGEAILMGRKGTIDRPLHVDCTFWTIDTMFYGIPNYKCNTRFLYFCITQMPFAYYSTSTALPSMTQFDLNNNPVAIPPPEEQVVIVKHIENESRKINAGISAQQAQIDKLKEYKASLINSAVTGKIKVI